MRLTRGRNASGPNLCREGRLLALEGGCGSTLEEIVVLRLAVNLSTTFIYSACFPRLNCIYIPKCSETTFSSATSALQRRGVQHHDNMYLIKFSSHKFDSNLKPFRNLKSSPLASTILTVFRNAHISCNCISAAATSNSVCSYISSQHQGQDARPKRFPADDAE